MTDASGKFLAPVIREVVVNASPLIAFDIFVQKAGVWWPAEHSLVSGRTNVIIEAVPGGRWFEIGENDTECQWGEVLEVERGERLLMAWQLSDEWTFNPNISSEIEVLFIADGDKTRVKLIHRKFQNMGPKVLEAYGAISGDSGWTAIIASFSAFASK